MNHEAGGNGVKCSKGKARGCSARKNEPVNGISQAIVEDKESSKTPFVKCFGTLRLCGDLVAKSYLTCEFPHLSSLPGSFLHEISQARIL